MITLPKRTRRRWTRLCGWLPLVFLCGGTFMLGENLDRFTGMPYLYFIRGADWLFHSNF